MLLTFTVVELFLSTFSKILNIGALQLDLQCLLFSGKLSSRETLVNLEL